MIISPENLEKNINTELITNNDIQETHKMIREFVEAEVGTEISKYLRIIYGGPVSQENAVELIKKEDVDGFLLHDEPSMTEQFEKIVDDID